MKRLELDGYNDSFYFEGFDQGDDMEICTKRNDKIIMDFISRKQVEQLRDFLTEILEENGRD